MSVFVAKVGRSGAGGANASYITRLNGAEKIAFHNLDQLESDDIHEARTNAIAYAHAREEIELEKGKKPKPKEKEPFDESHKPKTDFNRQSEAAGSKADSENFAELTENKIFKEKNKPTREKQIRTHYRLIASWSGKESNEKVVELVKVYLEKEFPKARAIIAVHQDTDDTHAHVWIDARQTDGKKIHLKEDKFEALDEKWTEAYDRAYGTNFAPEYKALKNETQKWKKEMYEWRKAKREKVEGAELKPQPIKPLRAADRFNTDYWKEKEVKELTGVKIDEKISAGTSYTDAQRTSRSAITADGFIDGAEFTNQKTDRADGGSKQTNQRTESDFSTAIDDSGEFIQPGSNNRQSPESNRTGFIENKEFLSLDDDQNTVYFPGAGSTSGETASSQISQEQFYATGLGFDQTGGITIFDANQRDFQRNSTIGKFNVELSQMPEIQYQAPQLQMDAQAMIKNTVDLITDSLERQGREMDELALCLYKEHLNGIATTPPSQSFIQKIDQFNRDSPKDDFIETENKSWLEAKHEYLSSMTTEKLDKEAVSIADEFEDDLIDRRKWDPEYRQQEGIDFVI